jgi:hypothetical protein
MQKATIIRDLLEEADIKVVMMNKSGYPYVNLGEIELFVFWQQAEQAIEIIEQAAS